jgi:hypothetical protein
MGSFLLGEITASASDYARDSVGALERFKLAATHPLAFVAYALLLGVTVYSVHGGLKAPPLRMSTESSGKHARHSASQQWMLNG